MEVFFACLDLKITQNKEKPLHSHFYSMGCHKMGSKGQAVWPQGSSRAQPQPLHPGINDPKYAVWGKLMFFVSSDSEQQMPVALRVEGNVRSEVLTLFSAFPNYPN